MLRIARDTYQGHDLVGIREWYKSRSRAAGADRVQAVEADAIRRGLLKPTPRADGPYT